MSDLHSCYICQETLPDNQFVKNGVCSICNDIKVEQSKSSQTHLDYWDCECKEHYIHSKKQSHCAKCDTYADNQPDSFVNEVEHYIA